MNLEQIDTSTTAGKAEVMRLAAEGRRVAILTKGCSTWREWNYPMWNWPEVGYAIIAETLSPEEVFAAAGGNWVRLFGTLKGASAEAKERGGEVIRYIRADLAVEGKP